MPRYIDMDSALQAHPEFLNEQIDDHDKAVYAKGWNACNSAYYGSIKELPFISPDEVRGVVHCEECKWWTKQEASIQGRCARLAIYPTGGFYCATGSKGANNAVHE